MIEIEGHTFIPEWLNADSVVLDVGGNHGNFAAEILQRFNCRVESYEPDITGFFYISSRMLHEKFAVHHRAVAGETGVRVFYCAGEINGGNSILPGHSEFERQGANAKTQNVFAVSMESVLQRFQRVDLMKLDCEGAEIEIIAKTSDAAWAKVRQVSIEFHGFCFTEMTNDVLEGARRRMLDLGFTETPPKNPADYGDRHYFRA